MKPVSKMPASKVELGEMPPPSNLQPMKVSADPTNPYLGLFKVLGDRLTVAVQPKSRNTALKVYSLESIPDTGALVSVRIIKLKHGAFAMGVVDKAEKRGKFRSPYLIGFAPGQLKFSADPRVAETQWTRVNNKMPINWNGCVVSMGVDMQKRVIHFYLDGKVYAYSPITDHLMKKELVLYIGCMHLGDCFALNAQ